MWSLVFFLCLTITWTEAQNGRGLQHQDSNGHGWDIRLAVPGEPGNDYPTLGAIPRTTFSCAGKEPGYYADLETNCQVFRVCTVGSTYGFQSFLCPNGTLFNQAVFVCDWWMNVKCKNSEQFMSNNNEKFENLRLGPQLMKDIKKMLTHPMRNPYDKNTMKSNYIVMQDYKPPTGQLFPNGALLAGPERPPNNVFVPSKQIQQNFIQSNPTDYTYSASTPDPRYILPPTNAKFKTNQKEEHFVQKQKQNGQYTRTGRVQTRQNLQQNDNLVLNSHTGRSKQNSKSKLNNNSVHPSQVTSFAQRQTNTLQTAQIRSTQNKQKQLANHQRSQVSQSRKIPQANNEKQTDFGNSFTESQNIQNSPLGLPKFSNEINGRAGKELKDNLVSTISNIPKTLVTKTQSKTVHKPTTINSNPRVTIKTWIVRPSKSARQLADPTPYTYERPSVPDPTPFEIFADVTTPLIYEMPTTFSLSVNNAQSEEPIYKEPYVNTDPTLASIQTQTMELETTRIYNGPLSNPTNPTFSELNDNLPSMSPLPTESSRYYLPPVSWNVERLYLPPPGDSTILSRQYLSPIAIPQLAYYKSDKLRTSPNIPNSTTSPLAKAVNSNHKNLTFTDILTKEKLDITVNDIVKDTDSILKTASPPQYNQYRKNFMKSLDLRQNDRVLIKATDSREYLTPQSPLPINTVISKSSRLIVTPATSLVPPDENFIYQNTNPLSKLPFYKESGLPNVIERTVSIKITIPENIAMYLFKNQSDADFDKLEVLNTGSSNYLVLSNKNNLVTKKNVFNGIPIAKLFNHNDTRTVFDSQALVYSFLTDSINAAREYRNIAQQEVLSSTVTPTPAYFQNLNNQQLTDITNNISQLTASQFSSNNFNSIDKNARVISTQPTYINQLIPFTGNLKYSNDHQARQIQSPYFNNIPSQSSQDEIYSARSQNPNTQQNVMTNPNNIYSGQLYRWPVPEVTNQFYNRPTSTNLINPNTLQRQTTQMFTLQSNTNQNNAAANLRQSTPAVEIIKAETVNLSPTKLNQDPSNGSEQGTDTESLTNLQYSGNGISAQLQDKIVGTVPHPIEQNKAITYRNNRSYYLYAKPDDNIIDENISMNTQTETMSQQETPTLQMNNNVPSSETFQLIPSVNYELEDVEEQQQILDAFQIDEFGAPRDIVSQSKNITENNTEKEIPTSGVDSSVEDANSAKLSETYKTSSPYTGSYSYTAPQSSVGRLDKVQVPQSNSNSRLENFDNNNEIGYPRERPARQFRY